MNRPLISIIVPIYKVEAYLERCIQSLIQQTYSHLEIILVDDGSPDACPLICDEFAQKDSRIRVIHKKNGGVSDARNTGLDIANGEFISFVDADDYVCPKMIETLFQLQERYHSEISVCNFFPFTEEVKKVHSKSIVETLSGKDAVRRLYQSQYATQAVVPWGKLYKRSLFNSLNFEVGKCYEDEFFSYKVLWKADKVTFTSQKLYYYLLRDSGISKAITNPNSLNGFDAKQEAIHFYKENGNNDIRYFAVRSFLNFSAKRYCFVHRITGNHQKLLSEILSRHNQVYKENADLLKWYDKIRPILFRIFPFSFWFFIKYDKIKQKRRISA